MNQNTLLRVSSKFIKKKSENIRVSSYSFLPIIEHDDVPPQYEEITKSFKSDPMSTSFYGSLPETEFMEETSLMPTSSGSYHEKEIIDMSLSSIKEVGEIANIESLLKLEESDLDFKNKCIKQSTSTTTSSQSVQSSKTETTSTFTTSTSETSSADMSTEIKKEEKLWDKPLGKYNHKTLRSVKMYFKFLSTQVCHLLLQHFQKVASTQRLREKRK